MAVTWPPWWTCTRSPPTIAPYGAAEERKETVTVEGVAVEAAAVEASVTPKAEVAEVSTCGAGAWRASAGAGTPARRAAV